MAEVEGVTDKDADPETVAQGEELLLSDTEPVPQAVGVIDTESEAHALFVPLAEKELLGVAAVEDEKLGDPDSDADPLGDGLPLGVGGAVALMVASGDAVADPHALLQPLAEERPLCEAEDEGDTDKEEDPVTVV